MRIINFIFFVLFILAAFVQYNDPDPLVWMAIYGIAAIHCYVAFKRKLVVWQHLPILMFCGIYATYLFVAENGVYVWLHKYHAASITGSMKAEQPWIENTREFFGLLIIILVIAGNLISRRGLKTNILTNRVHPGIPR